MNIQCPKCKNELEVVDKECNDGKMRCAKCNSTLTLKRTVEVNTVPEEVSLPPAEGKEDGNPIEAKSIDKKKILVAIDGETIAVMINEVLIEAGFEVINSADGRKALSLLISHRPIVAILDVGLPQIFGFEISEIIKKSESLKDTFVILVASVFDPTRYKREPQSLFGADDYIEKHHIRDYLIPKIRQLLGEDIHRLKTEATLSIKVEIGSTQTEQRAITPLIKEHEKEKIKEDEIPIVDSRAVDIRQTESGKKPEAQLQGDPVFHEKAKRFARIIISDIALYNQKAVEEGIRNGNFYDLLKGDIEEGKRIYKERVPKEIYESTSYFEEALEEFIRKKRQSLTPLQPSIVKE